MLLGTRTDELRTTVGDADDVAVAMLIVKKCLSSEMQREPLPGVDHFPNICFISLDGVQTVSCLRDDRSFSFSFSYSG